jgi:hypothetical protein
VKVKALLFSYNMEKLVFHVWSILKSLHMQKNHL